MKLHLKFVHFDVTHKNLILSRDSEKVCKGNYTAQMVHNWEGLIYQKHWHPSSANIHKLTVCHSMRRHTVGRYMAILAPNS